MSSNANGYNERADMYTKDLQVGQELVRLIVRRPSWGNGPITLRKELLVIEKITKTRLVLKSAQGTVYRVLVSNSRWNAGQVKDILEGDSDISYAYRDDFTLYTKDEPRLFSQLSFVEAHNRQAQPELEAKAVLGAISTKGLSKELALEAIVALQAYVDTRDA